MDNTLFYLSDDEIVKVEFTENIKEGAFTEITKEEALDYIDYFLEFKYKNSRDSSSDTNKEAMYAYLKGTSKHNIEDKLKHPIANAAHGHKEQERLEKLKKQNVEGYKFQKGPSMGTAFNKNGTYYLKKGSSDLQKRRDLDDKLEFNDKYRDEIKVTRKKINELKSDLLRAKLKKDEKSISEISKKIEILERNLNNLTVFNLDVNPSPKKKETKEPVTTTRNTLQPA